MSAARMLRHSRRRAGLSQRALAEATGVPQPAIARIERGAVSPRLDTLERLLAGTGMTVELAPQPGRGVDLSLIRDTLAMSPEERIASAGRAGSELSRFSDAVRCARAR